MVDEAHATGLYGKTVVALRKNWASAIELKFRWERWAKRSGASGGYICGSRALIDFLINRARSFIFSTAPVPAAAAAATAGIRFVQSEARRTATPASCFGRRVFRTHLRNFKPPTLPVAAPLFR